MTRGSSVVWTMALGFVMTLFGMRGNEVRADEQPEITLLSPRPLQVVQRETKAKGWVIVSGRVKSDSTGVEVRFSGKGMDGDLPDQWQPVGYDAQNRGF